MTSIFDVPCFFGRDITKFQDFACAWYGNKLPDPKGRVHEKPLKILYPKDFMLDLGHEQKCLIEHFVEDLESALGVKRIVLSLAEEWESSGPENLAKQGLQDYMQNVCTSLPNHPTSHLDLVQAPTHAFFYDLYHDFDSFRERFGAEYHKAPYVSPMLRWRWLVSKAHIVICSKLRDIEGKLLKR